MFAARAATWPRFQALTALHASRLSSITLQTLPHRNTVPPLFGGIRLCRAKMMRFGEKAWDLMVKRVDSREHHDLAWFQYGFSGQFPQYVVVALR